VRRWSEQPAIKRCYHPAAPEGCGKIIRAHAVQRGSNGLSALAQRGKVYGFRLHPSFFLRRGMRLEPDLVGIGDASTFYGFCERHDSALFRELESAAFEATPRQLLLLNFRAITRRLHSNEAALGPSVLDGLDQGIPPHLQRWEFADVEDMKLNAREAFENTTLIKKINDEALTDPDADLNALVVLFAGQPEMAMSTLVDVPRDFRGNLLPRVGPPAHLSFHVLPTSVGAVAAFVWLGSNPSAEQLALSLLESPPHVVPHLILNLAIACTDLVFYSPEWWDSLRADQRDAIIERATALIRPDRDPESNALVDDGLRLSRVTFVEGNRIGRWSCTEHPA
jgi:hypothetical protein